MGQGGNQHGQKLSEVWQSIELIAGCPDCPLYVCLVSVKSVVPWGFLVYVH